MPLQHLIVPSIASLHPPLPKTWAAAHEIETSRPAHGSENSPVHARSCKAHGHLNSPRLNRDTKFLRELYKRGATASQTNTMRMSSYPTAEEYCRWGLSAKGARHVHTLFGAPESTTTAAVCHTFIKTRTTPPGRQHRASPSNEGGRQRYSHEYVNVATGQAHNSAPLKTCSLCQLLATVFRRR